MRRVVFVTLLLPVAASGAEYAVSPLVGAQGSYQSVASGTSSAGTSGASVAFDGTSLASSPAIWQGGQISLLPLPAGYEGGTTGINSSGQVVGAISPPSFGQTLPALWTGGELQMLDTLSFTGGVANGVNDNGVVVGQVGTESGGVSYAVAWDHGQATEISGYDDALAVNDAGQILVSASGTYSVLSNGVANPITAPAGSFVNARGLGGQGHVAGEITDAQGDFMYGFIWNGSAVAQLLPMLGDSTSLADAINDSDQVVGYSYNATDGIRAVLWQNGQVIDLNSLVPANSGWSLEEAMDIINGGVIVGYGQFDGTTTAFELTPTASPSVAVPEPASLAIFALGATALLRRRRR